MNSAAWMPSCEALCASQGAPAQSPMANRPLTLVWQWPSVLMWPRSSSTPSASRPMPSVLAVMPTAEMQTSASSDSALPPTSVSPPPPPRPEAVGVGGDAARRDAALGPQRLGLAADLDVPLHAGAGLGGGHR